MLRGHFWTASLDLCTHEIQQSIPDSPHIYIQNKISVLKSVHGYVLIVSIFALYFAT
jgi:hypothetical protein